MKILEIFTKNRIIGNLGEREAVKHLRRHGYRILERNYVALGHEIDVIARKKNITAFVEVKARNVKYLGYREARPASAVTPEKQRKIISTANYYSRVKKLNTRMRFDIIEVYLSDKDKGVKIEEVKHLEGAYDWNTAHSIYKERDFR